MKILRVRRFIQILATFFQNGYTGFLSTGSLYTGVLKRFCSPGLNCYSCPAAFFSCPLGSLQQIMISAKLLPWSYLSQVFLYLLGYLLLMSLFLGRFICGWLCPFGLLQELLYKIPFYKRTFNLPYRAQRYLKHLLLIFFVLLFPALFIKEIGYGILWFCKYVCPVGTLEAGYLNLLIQPALMQKVGIIFAWKSLLFIGILLFCLMELRFFCKNLCPLGLIYGIFNKFSLFRLNWIKKQCTGCTICEKVCPMQLTIPKELNSVECIRCLNCLEVCPTKAIHLEKSLQFLPERHQIDFAVEGVRDAKRRKSL